MAIGCHPCRRSRLGRLQVTAKWPGRNARFFSVSYLFTDIIYLSNTRFLRYTKYSGSLTPLFDNRLFFFSSKGLLNEQYCDRDGPHVYNNHPGLQRLREEVINSRVKPSTPGIRK